MHDIKWIRDNPEAFDEGLARRGWVSTSGVTAQSLLKLDESRRKLQTAAQEIQTWRNKAAKEIGFAKAKGEDASALIEEVSRSKEVQAKAEDEARQAAKVLEEALAAIPNLPASLRNRLLYFLLRWEAYDDVLACLEHLPVAKRVSIQDMQADALDPVYSKLDDTVEWRLQAVPDVERVEPGIYTWVATDELPFLLIFGYDPASVAIQHYRIIDGQPLKTSGQMVLGQRAAEALKKGVGDTVRIYGQPYRIAGIFETGQGMEESGAVLTIADAQSIAQLDRKVSLYQVGLRQGTDVEATMTRIDALDLDLSVSRTSDRESNQQWQGALQGFAWGIAAIAILIGGLGMMNSMVMSVLERTREIGTLRAVGWSRSHVLRLILGEALVLSLTGGVMGGRSQTARKKSPARRPIWVVSRARTSARPTLNRPSVRIT